MQNSSAIVYRTVRENTSPTYHSADGDELSRKQYRCSNSSGLHILSGKLRRVLIVSSLHHTITLVFAGKAKTSCYYLYNLLLYSCAPFPYQCLLTTCNRVLFCRCDVLNQAYLKCTKLHCLYHYTHQFTRLFTAYFRMLFRRCDGLHIPYLICTNMYCFYPNTNLLDGLLSVPSDRIESNVASVRSNRITFRLLQGDEVILFVDNHSFIESTDSLM